MPGAGRPGLISLVILAHNKAAVTRRCLAGLRQTGYRPLEVILVDNGSTDDTPAVLADFAAAPGDGVAVTVLKNDEVRGCSTARNQGIGRATGEAVVFLDNDVVVRSRSWLERLRAALFADERRGIAGPKLLFPVPPYRIQFAGGAVSPSGRVGFIGRGELPDDPRFNSAGDVQCFISACLMIRADLLRAVGGFDEAFNPIQFEDIDLCYKVKERGFSIRYVPEAELYHFENVTSAGTPRLNYRYLTIKHGLKFKERWRQVFSQENGPSDAEVAWREIPKVPLDAVGDLPLID